MQQPTYNIQAEKQLLRVTLAGKWSLASDRAYLEDLSRAFAQINTRPWGVLIDMRNWQLGDNLFQPDLAQIHLDRTNQLFECWVVATSDQANELVDFVEAIPNLRFRRFLSMDQAREWIKLFNIEGPGEDN